MKAVLRVTSQIPHGEVRSYRWVAQCLKKPKATRAVGNAPARNPIPIIIPCHRVVRSDGTLGGFALGESNGKKDCWSWKILGDAAALEFDSILEYHYWIVLRQRSEEHSKNSG